MNYLKLVKPDDDDKNIKSMSEKRRVLIKIIIINQNDDHII
jgi:hypothetical protein